MAVIDTTNLGLHTWAEGEHPGAGSQTQIDSGGLNDNWLHVDVAVGLQHNADGTHRANVIKGSNLVQSGSDRCTDNATIEFSSNMMQLKDDGITAAKLGDIVDGSSLEQIAGVLGVKDSGITGAKLRQTGSGAVVDETTLEFSSNEMRVKDDGITSAKISHDNTRTKACFWFNGTTDANFYMKVGSIQTSASVGIPMPRAGAVTKVATCQSGGTVENITHAYETSGHTHFNAHDKLAAINNDIANVGVKINGVDALTSAELQSCDIMVVEVEFDD